MSENRGNVDGESVAAPSRGRGLAEGVKRAGIYVGLALVVLLLGLVTMWLRAREAARERDAARRELQVSRMQNALASAAVDAQRGEYEPARQAASEFYTNLRTELDRGRDSAFTQAQQNTLRPLFDSRDDTITLLARSDPAVAERLVGLYNAYRQAAAGAPAR